MEYTLNQFNSLFSEYQQRFVRFAISYLRDESLAEDYVADSMTAFWQARGSLSEDTNVPAYVLTVLKNKCINELNRQKTHARFLEVSSESAKWELEVRINSLTDFSPEEVFTKEIREIVQKTLASMPEQTRRVFEMSRKQGLSNKRIATILGISEKGVEYHITKVNKILRVALADYITASVILFYLL